MRKRQGFTLVEVVIATVVFTIGGLGLAATSASIARLIAANTLRSNAVDIARARAEVAHGAGCAVGMSGEARQSGIHSVWTVTGSGVGSLNQALVRTDAFGTHSDSFISAIPCG
jgi:prepilin-type N-terminal cleavage/methylation domain-containing protein